MNLCRKRIYRFFNTPLSNKYATYYVQGQEPESKVREYFYFIDHQGMVSL